MTVVFWIALIFGFYMAWSIGANDAANAMGTSVGSKAVSFKEAVIIAAIFEFSGAFFAGSGVANTMRKGIIDPASFDVLGPEAGATFALGMLAALMSAAIWIHIAAFLGWPVSTTHSIVGAITGFGIAALGFAAVQWGKLGFIVASWVTSPLLGGIFAFIVFYGIRKTIFDSKTPIESATRWSPVFSFPVFIVLGLVLLFKGLKNFRDKETGLFDIAGFEFDWIMGLGLIAAFAVVASVVTGLLIKRAALKVPDDVDKSDPDALKEAQHAQVEKIYRYLQVITACFVAFAHGSNDVANSIGPLAAIVGMYQDMEFVGNISSKVPVPGWVLLLGAVGIVLGLASYGWKVIETVGTKITEITPSRGFAAEFGAASTILIGSQLGLPLSTTHTIVGAVIGVGFARGVNALNLKIILSIIQSWIYTIPFTGVLSVVLFLGLRAVFL